MGIVDAIAAAVTDDGSEADGTGGDRIVTYRCVACDATFERSSTRMVKLRCPECGSADLRDAEYV